ncbi:MAG: FHA domain-containing protein [Spirochaetales bacterium]|nr:MAG: FHA domain-containing protein [Spirochaetales bacterium]
MDETIAGQSPVGQRLSSIPRTNMKFLVFQGKKVRMIDQMTIGRDKSNAITINDPLVSRVHCIVRRIRSAWYIEDAGSTNGTWVNEKRVMPGKARRLKPEDTILLGGRIEVSLK